MDITVRDQIPAAQMAIYRAAARRRQQQQAQHLAQRRERAWQTAQQAAHILKEQFGARQVYDERMRLTKLPNQQDETS